MASIPSPAVPASSAVYPSAARSWLLVIALTVAYVFSFIDRYILGMLADPIKAEFGLSDTQMGLLLGPAFAIFYALIGLPLGWLADRKRRTFIVAAGIALWSLATAFTGIARSYLQIFLARMAVGVGEAALSPCTMSLIADSFPKERRAKPIALYSTALSVGAGLALLAGGAVVAWATTTDAVTFAGIGPLAPWQLTMIAVGLPGLLLVPILLFLPEPKRQEENHTLAGEQPTFRETLRFIGGKWPLFVSFIVPFCLMTIIGYSTGWGAPMFGRTFGWSITQYSLWAGIMFLIVGPATVNFAGWLSDRLYQSGREDAPLLISLSGVPIMILAGLAWPLMPTGEIAIVVLGITMAGVALPSAVGVTALLNITPSRIRGQTVAIYYVVISLFGLGFGPTTVGLLSDYVFGETGIRYSIAALAVIFGLPVLAVAPLTIRKYREELRLLRNADGAE